ncbi:MAG TPA: hypothetical protein VGC65_00380 [Bacteroidia bacterium]|jgi:hypothetical protein
MRSEANYNLFLKGQAFYYKMKELKYKPVSIESSDNTILNLNGLPYGEIVALNKAFFIVRSVGIIQSFDERIFFIDVNFMESSASEINALPEENAIKEMIELFTDSEPYMVRRITKNPEYKKEKPVFDYLVKQNLIRISSEDRDFGDVIYIYTGPLVNNK